MPIFATPAAGDGEFDIAEATIESIHGAFASGELSCREVVQAYLDRIAAYDDQLDPPLNAVQTVNPNALAEAEALDAAYATSGPVGSLHCIPALVKDQVEVAGMPTTYGSALFEGFDTGRDATIVQRMKDEGAIIIGKATMGEFASRYVGSAFGICRNPYDVTRNPSGSSCGTGVGIAANFATLGIGEDTGGSIRGPAAVANLVGLRPTLPLVSRYGMMPASPTRDTLGPITRTVEDAARLTTVIAGFDPNDPITAASIGETDDYTEFLSAKALAGARIGVLRTPMDEDTEPESEDYAKVKAVIDQAIADMAAQGAEIVDPLEIPGLLDLLDRSGSSAETEEAIDAYLAQLPTSPVESFRDIAVSDLVTPTRRNGLINALNRSTNDIDHLRSLAAREELRQLVLQVMADNDLDAVLYATFDHQATEIPVDVETNRDTADEYGKGSNRSLSPAVGFPALTLPAGFTTDGLPVGVELMGRPWSEGLLFGLGYDYEQATGHRRPPEVAPALAP